MQIFSDNYILLFNKMNFLVKKIKADKIVLVILSLTMLCWTKITNDSWAYIHGANSILEGFYFFENTHISMRPVFPPLYSLYLTIFIKFFGNNVMPILFANVVLFLTSCLLYFKIDENYKHNVPLFG